MNPVSDDYILSTAWRRWQIIPKKVSHDEWASPCPVCGGKDRFRIFQNDGGYWCRRMEGTCSMKGWLDDDKQKDFKPDPNWKTNQAKREQALRDERISLVMEWQNSYRAHYWKGWHENLTSEHREWFHDRGISDEVIDHYGFGYCPEKLLEDGTLIPAYTMPCRSPEDWSVVNVHFRLVGRDTDKYRYDFLKDKKLPAAPFYCEPHGAHKKCIIVEGTFKAVVVYETMERNIQVVGLPSSMPHHTLFEEIAKHYEIKSIWLDPGAESAAQRVARLLEFQNTRVVSTAWKPDDAILYHSHGMRSVQAWLKQGKPIYSIPKEDIKPKARPAQVI